LGETLEILRRERRLSRLALARLSGVSQNWITSIERGRDSRGGVPHPTPIVLRELARGLSVDPLTGDVDEDEARGLHLRLMRAAGYLEPGAELALSRTAEEVRQGVMSQLAAEYPDLEAAFAEVGNWEREDIDYLKQTVRIFRRYGRS
jgi:transcriptional regulator with XRE-family HTH domain